MVMTEPFTEAAFAECDSLPSRRRNFFEQKFEATTPSQHWVGDTSRTTTSRQR
jgi:hypothetical protein